jgi:predicted nucleic acid-binding Zn ribbon protein
MHCVVCGTLLHAENQTGLGCWDCKHKHQENRRTRGMPIRVNYCYICGKAFHPSDASIKHENCQTGFSSPSVSLKKSEQTE